MIKLCYDTFHLSRKLAVIGIYIFTLEGILKQSIYSKPGIKKARLKSAVCHQLSGGDIYVMPCHLADTLSRATDIYLIYTFEHLRVKGILLCRGGLLKNSCHHKEERLYRSIKVTQVMKEITKLCLSSSIPPKYLKNLFKDTKV